LVRLCDRRAWREYLLFGAILGLGCLSKYNFAIAAVSLLAAALLLPEGRRALLDWRMLVALGVAAVLVTPHLIWAFGHPELALASAEKFKVADEAAGWGATFQGLGKALKLTLGAVGPTLLVFALALIRSRPRASADGQTFAPRLLLRMLLVAALLVIAGTVIFHATNFRGRWFLPLLVGVPVLVSTALWSRLTTQRVRALLVAGLAVVAVVTVLLPARIILAERLKRMEPLHQPYSRLAPQLQPDVGSNTVILAATKVIAGNLRLAGLRAVVVTPETWLVIPHPDTDVLLVWDATRRPEPDEKFAQAIETLGLRAGAAPRSIEAVCFYHSTTAMRLASVRAGITSSQPGSKSN
jgi:4-amino-4-deoxy-L-arabinose transferase-like glycosyltransferase